MIKLCCYKCGKDISEIDKETLLKDLCELGMSDRWRFRDILHETDEERPSGKTSEASLKEIEVVRQIGQELVAFLVCEVKLCDECQKAELSNWDPLSTDPSLSELPPEDQLPELRIVKCDRKAHRDE